MICSHSATLYYPICLQYLHLRRPPAVTADFQRTSLAKGTLHNQETSPHLYATCWASPRVHGTDRGRERPGKDQAGSALNFRSIAASDDARHA